MIISLKCNVSLSKKLRALARNNAKFTMVTGSLANGIGEGVITFETSNDADLSDLLNKETSIMIVPVEQVDQDMQMSDVDNSSRVSNIFMSGENVEESESPIIKKIGAVRPPNNKNENSTSIKSKAQQVKETPAPFKVTQNPDAKKYITNLSQLLEAIKLAENKTHNVDPSKIQNPRMRAVAMEEKEKAEAIDYPAFIVNDSCAVLTINDLGISLSLNIPYNLNNLSAKRLANSKELQLLFRQNLVKFIRPDQVKEYMDKVLELDKHGLEVYDNRRQAEAAIGEMGETKSQMVKVSEENDLSLKELEGDTEEEKILKSLPPRRELLKEFAESDEIIVTSHRGNDSSLRNQRDITAEATQNSKGMKSIRRSGIQYN